MLLSKHQRRCLYQLILFFYLFNSIIFVSPIKTTYEKQELLPDSEECNIPFILMFLQKDFSSINNKNKQATFSYNLTFEIEPGRISNYSDQCISINIYITDLKSKNYQCSEIPVSKDIYETKTFCPNKVEQFDNSAQLNFRNKFIVKKTGFHRLVITNNLPSSISYQGTSEQENSFGHLSGDIYGFLPFFLILSITILLISLVQFLTNLRFRKDLINLQHFLSLMLFICLVEFFSQFCYYNNLNSYGISNNILLLHSLLTTVFRRSISRILVIAVSLGYGVVRPSLKRNEYTSLAVVGGIYFVFESLNEIAILYDHINDVDTKARYFIVTPSIILNVIFYWQIFISLTNTLSELKSSQQFEKLALYERFSRVLATLLFVAVCMSFYSFVQMTYWLNYQQMQSQRQFIENGFWQILYVIVLLSMMYLQKPSQNQRNIAYSLQVPSQLDDYKESETLKTVENFENDFSENEDLLTINDVKLPDQNIRKTLKLNENSESENSSFDDDISDTESNKMFSIQNSDSEKEAVKI